MIAPDEPICTFSSDRRYRYTLWREVNPEGRGITAFICLNPSTADESIEDPTVRRCMRFARDWGSRYFCMLNVFGYRATDPRDMKAQHDPTGVHNLYHVVRVARQADHVIAAWGVHGNWIGGNTTVINALGDTVALKCLGKTRDGHPRHPLYIKASQQPIDYP